MTIRNINPISLKFITGVAMLALIAGFSPAGVQSAFADDCLLDTNNDGDVDLTDTDGGADSSGDDERLACGVGASAAGSFSTALGGLASAGGGDSIALGYSASAAAFSSTALGSFANAAEDSSTAVGNSANAAGVNSTAVGNSATAAESSSTALGRSANATGIGSTALGANSSASMSASTAIGDNASATAQNATALGDFAVAAGDHSAALGADANASADFSTAVGRLANAVGLNSTALGSGSSTGSTFAPMATAVGANAQATGDQSTALGGGSSSAFSARATTTHSIAIGGGSSGASGAISAGVRAIAIGNKTVAGHSDAIVIGSDTASVEDGQVILGHADTFTIRGNGDVGIGTANPNGTLDVNSGVDDSIFLLTNDTAVWEFKSNAANGKLTFGNKTTGTKPFKFGPDAIGNLLQVGIVATDQVDIKGDLVLVGTLTTGGPTCGGGCDAVFGEDYDLPSIEEHAAQMYANSYLPQVGPTVPHAPMNISEKVGDMLNELEKAHIYIAQLKAERDADRKRIDRLEAYLVTQSSGD